MTMDSFGSPYISLNHEKDFKAKYYYVDNYYDDVDPYPSFYRKPDYFLCIEILESLE